MLCEQRNQSVYFLVSAIRGVFYVRTWLSSVITVWSVKL